MIAKNEAGHSLSDYSWLKLYCVTPKDDKLKGHAPATKWLWVCLMVLAREADDPGYIPAFKSTPEWLAGYAEIKVKDAERALELFANPEIGMIHRQEDGRLLLPNFVRRQASVDATAAQRMHRYRNKHRNVTSVVTDHETEKLRVETETETETDGEGETEGLFGGEIRPSSSNPNIVDPTSAERAPAFEIEKAKELARESGFTGDVELSLKAFIGHYEANGWLQGGGLPIVDRYGQWLKWMADEMGRFKQQSAPRQRAPNRSNRYQASEQEMADIRAMAGMA